MWSPLNFLPVALAASLVSAANTIAQPSLNLSLPILGNQGTALLHDRIPFILTVSDAVHDTLRHYPRATLRKIEASTNGVAAVDDPKMLTDVRMIFAIPGRAPYHSLVVQMSRRWARWLAPQLSRLAPPQDCQPIPVYGYLPMDILEADQLIKAHGYTQKYLYVDVGLPAGSGEVVYSFEMDLGLPGTPDVVAVGTRSRDVEASFYADEDVLSHELPPS